MACHDNNELKLFLQWVYIRLIRNDFSLANPAKHVMTQLCYYHVFFLMFGSGYMESEES